MSTLPIGEILALGAAASGALSSIILSSLGKKVDSSLLGFVRMVIVVPLMVALALIADGTAIFGASIKEILLLSVSGIIGFFVTDVFLFRAYALFGAQQTMVVMCFTPVLSTVFSVFLFSEVPSLMQIVGISMTVLGILISISRNIEKKASFFSYGCICALLAAVFQSFADLTAKASLTSLPWISCASVRGVSGLLGWLAFLPFAGKKLFKDYPVLRLPRNFALLCTSVVVSTWLGTTMAMGSLKFAPAGIATSLKQLSPILILPYDFFILKKKSIQSIIGTVVAVAGVILIFS